MVTVEELLPYREETVALYRQLHEQPELGYEERLTSRLIAKKLTEYGLAVKTGLAITGVLGVLESGRSGKTILLRADMDALAIEEKTGCDFASTTPGKMHACGHDAHMAMLLTAAKYLATNREKFSGRVKFVFQPAEENASAEMRAEAARLGYHGMGGAGFMIQEGALTDVDACYAIHVSPLQKTGMVFINEGKAMASSDKFTATLIGTGGHGAAPHKGVDPVAAAAAVMDAYHLLPAREISASDTCVVSIGTIQTPSSSWNILPERIVISGNIRTFDDAVREYVVRRLEELLAGIAGANRCRYEFERMRGYNATINDRQMVQRAAAVAAKLLGEKNVVLSDVPFMSSEDVGNYFIQVPGALIWLGVGDGTESQPGLHSPYFRLDPAALAIGAAIHVNNVLDFLNG